MSLSTNNNKIVSGDPYVQLEVAKERTKYLEEKVFQQRREREKALTMLRRQEAELKRLEKHCSDLCIELEVKKQQLKYTEDIITLHNQKNVKRNASITCFSCKCVIFVFIYTRQLWNKSSYR